jgi:hypothetical protein
VLRVVCLIALLVFVGRADAQTPNSEADRLFEEGRALAKEKKYAEACDRFERSFKLEPTVGTQLNLADCHEQLGHLRQAWQLFEDAAEKSALTDDQTRTTFARERADGVVKRLAVVVIHVPQPTPAGMTVSIAGRVMPVSGPDVRDRVEPGDIAITATIPDRPLFTTTVKATAGATAEVTIPARQVDKPVIGGTKSPRTSRIRLAWGLAGVGAVAGVAGSILTLKGRSNYNSTADGEHCSRVTGGIVCDETGDKQIADAQRLADFGTVCAIGTAAFAIAAAAVYFTAPREVQVTPVVTGSGVGVFVGRSF